MHVGDADGTVASVGTDDRAADEGMMVDVGGLEDVPTAFSLMFQRPRHSCATRLPWGWRCRCLRRRPWTARG